MKDNQEKDSPSKLPPSKEEKPSVYYIEAELNSQELDWDYQDVLKAHGELEDEISRDILIPSNMTLHTLHYVLQRAFGWQNINPHRFSICSEDFNAITGGSVPASLYEDIEPNDGSLLRWIPFCGSYFRFPCTESYEYDWDEDYQGETNIPAWLKKKYTHPKPYSGTKEHFIACRREMEQLIRNHPEFCDSIPEENESLSLEEWFQDSEITVAEFNEMMGVNCNELLERLPLSQVLYPCYERESRSPEDPFEKANALFKKYKDCYDQKGNPKKGASFAQPGIAYSEEKIPLPPIASLLNYEYDYDSGWVVNLILRDVYHVDKENPLRVLSHDGKEQKPTRAKQVLRVQNQGCPICVRVDGLSVFEEVGGYNEYADFLENLYEYGDESLLDWAVSKGWSPNKILPSKLL